MEYLYLAGTIIVSLTIFEVIQMVFQTRFGPKPQASPLPKPPIANLIAELDMLIDLEILGVVEIPMMVKEIQLITNFKETQMEVIRNVTDNLSSSFFIEANKCGIKRKYVLTYITRRTHVKLLEFMQKHNFSLK